MILIVKLSFQTFLLFQLEENCVCVKLGLGFSAIAGGNANIDTMFCLFTSFRDPILDQSKASILMTQPSLQIRSLFATSSSEPRTASSPTAKPTELTSQYVHVMTSLVNIGDVITRDVITAGDSSRSRLSNLRDQHASVQIASGDGVLLRPDQGVGLRDEDDARLTQVRPPPQSAHTPVRPTRRVHG